MMRPRKDIGPTIAVATAIAERDAQQQPAYAFVVVHAEVCRLVPAQCEHVEQRELLSQREDYEREQREAEHDYLAVHVGEKLATRLLRSVSYSFGSMTRVNVLWMLEKKLVSTVPTSRT